MVVLVFCLLEFVLRITGIAVPYAAPNQVGGFSAAAPVFEEDKTLTENGRLTTEKRKLEWFNSQTFSRQKSAQAKRVFCIGGSTTYGRPYDDRTSFCGWLREFLPVADNEATWEIINAGGISYGSKRVLNVLREVVEYDPNLIIIYCGHNEFLERTTYPTISSLPEPVLRMSAFLEQHSALFRSLRSVASRPTAQTPENTVDPENVEAILDSSVGLDAYQRDEDWQALVVNAYAANIRTMLQICEAKQIAVVVVVPASQLKDCAPFKSQHNSNLRRGNIIKSDSLLARASSALNAGDQQRCCDLCDELIALDPEFAHGHYLKGMAEFSSENFSQSKESLIRARDTDVCPLRATSIIIDTLRSTATNFDCSIVDFESIADKLAKHGVPGNDLFLDHVHPTIDLNRKLALALLAQMQTDALISADQIDDHEISAVTQRVTESIDTAAHGLALRNLSKVLSWAGKYEEADRLAVQAMELLPDDSESQFQAAGAYFRRGDSQRAMNAFQRAVQLDPNSAQAHYGVGLMYAERGNWTSAIQHYQTASALKPNFIDIEFNLGRAYEQSGDLKSALRQYETCIGLNDCFAPAYNGMGTVHAQQGDLATAIKWFQKALAADPEDRDAQANLKTAVKQQTK